MGINTKYRYLHGEEGLRWALELSNPALDDIWKEAWLRDGIGSRMTDSVKALEMEAGSMRYRCDRIALVAEGAVADMLQAMLALAQGPATEVSAERARTQTAVDVAAGASETPTFEKVRLVRASLSAGELSETVEWLRQGRAGLIGVAAEPETKAFRAIFATLRKLVADKHPQEKKARIKAISGPRSIYLRQELELGDMEGIPIPEEYDPWGNGTAGLFGKGSVERAWGWARPQKNDTAAGATVACLAGSVAMLFPMMVAGVNAGDYVRGFREMLSSPWWDQDADRFGVYMGSVAVCSLENASVQVEDILCWQPELLGVCRWLAVARQAWDVAAQALYMPREEALLRESAARITFLCNEEPADILLPVFPGVSPEGSLNQMTREAAEALYEQRDGVLITLDSLDAAELGRLMAYLQLSLGIAGWIPRNR